MLRRRNDTLPAERRAVALLLPACQLGKPLAMRIALYLVMTVVLIPYALLAAGFVLLDHALADGTLGSLVRFLLRVALWLIEGGLLVVAAALLALLILAANDRWRWIGFGCLCLAALASLAAIVFLSAAPIEPGQWLFLAPCLLAAVCSAWLARAELRDQHPAARVPAGPGPREPAP
jgi:hypothetical protein